MRTSAAIILFLALALLAAGCQSDKKVGPSIGDAFIGGTSALKLSFVTNSPPAEVTDVEKNAKGEIIPASGFPFDATVTIQNVGETTLNPNEVTVSLSGFFPGDFLSVTGDSSAQTSKSWPAAEFRGVSKDPNGNKIPGDIDQVTFPTTASVKFKYNKVLSGNQQFPFRADVCYPYETKVVSQLCIMKDLTANQKTVCNPTGLRPVSNSGAPVQVSSIAESVGGKDKAILNFNVKKVGQSQLFLSGCSDSFANKERVTVDINTGLNDAASSLKCLGLIGSQSLGNSKFSGQVILTDGSASFTCIQTLGGSDRVDSLKTFDILLSYTARDSITTNVVVKHLI